MVLIETMGVNVFARRNVRCGGRGAQDRILENTDIQEVVKGRGIANETKGQEGVTCQKAKEENIQQRGNSQWEPFR